MLVVCIIGQGLLVIDLGNTPSKEKQMAHKKKTLIIVNDKGKMILEKLKNHCFVQPS